MIVKVGTTLRFTNQLPFVILHFVQNDKDGEVAFAYVTALERGFEE